MLRVVIDTNVVLSALLFGGKPRKVLEAAFEGNIQLYTSGVLLTELERVLGREKFGFSPRFIQNILVEITNISEWTETNQSMTIIKEDPTDNRIIECAIEAEAHYIITGDNHLLRLEQIEGIKIVNPDKMLEILKANEE
jgi:putative PIN family toxin of toxin-antitoxin system